MIPSIRARWADVAADGGPITVDDLLALPEDRWRYELIDRKLVLRPQADLRYAMIVSGLTEALHLWAAGADTGGTGGTTVAETGFVVSVPGALDTVYVPALAYVRGGQLAAGDDTAGTGSVRLVPDLVVEIASPVQQREELAERASKWLSAGVRLVWVIWPARRQVEVWRLAGGGGMVRRRARQPRRPMRSIKRCKSSQSCLASPIRWRTSSPIDEQPRLSTARRRAIRHLVVRYACGLN